ncbi:MAG: 4Fe-4S binding protein, partial [Pirellulales bacterium]|nr:4Fe-4S binding protein [Pirellulales bacterium]
LRANGWGPMEIVRDDAGAVTGVRFRRCLRVYEPGTKKFSPVYDEADQKIIPCDTVLLAVGQAPNIAFLEDGGKDVEQFRPGWPKTDRDTLMSSAPGVFVAGDLAHGTRLLIDAVASGKKAARSVYQYLTGRELEAQSVTAHLVLERYRRERGYESIRRVAVPVCPPEQRLDSPDTLVEIGYNAGQAMREASRCLDCGVTPVFDGARCVLCGGCADVCPTQCLKLVSLADLEPTAELESAIRLTIGEDDLTAHSAILKDEDRCIRCALCAMRCPSDAITMERVICTTSWRSL